MASSLACCQLVVWAATVLLPDPGVTRWIVDSSEPRAPYGLEVETPGAGWLLVELDGSGPFADHDLVVRGQGWTHEVRGHLARERALVPVLAGERLAVSVPSEAGGWFRLGLTLLTLSGRLTPGDSTGGRLELGAQRAALHRLEQGEGPSWVELALERLEGAGDLDLLAFDARMDLVALGEARAEGERILLEVGAGPVLVVVRQEGPPVRYGLTAEPRGDQGSAIEEFLGRLARTPAQERAVAALRKNPDFVRIRSYLEGYPGGLPLRLRVVPGLTAHGVERFGTYSQGTLAINPTILGHRENVQELIDTLIHELVHAILALPSAPGFPLAPDVLDSSHDPRLQGLLGMPLKRGRLPEPLAGYLESDYGPSASNPEHDYSDVNAGAQRLIMKVVRDNVTRTGLGRETLVFQNAQLRAGQQAPAGVK